MSAFASFNAASAMKKGKSRAKGFCRRPLLQNPLANQRPLFFRHLSFIPQWHRFTDHDLLVYFLAYNADLLFALENQTLRRCFKNIVRWI
jgi:hypothetical protein